MEIYKYPKSNLYSEEQIHLSDQKQTFENFTSNPESQNGFYSSDNKDYQCLDQTYPEDYQAAYVYSLHKVDSHPNDFEREATLRYTSTNNSSDSQEEFTLRSTSTNNSSSSNSNGIEEEIISQETQKPPKKKKICKANTIDSKKNNAFKNHAKVQQKPQQSKESKQPKFIRQGNIIRDVCNDAVSIFEDILIYLRELSKTSNQSLTWSREKARFIKELTEKLIAILSQKQQHEKRGNSIEDLIEMINIFKQQNTFKSTIGIKFLIYGFQQKNKKNQTKKTKEHFNRESPFDRYQIEAFKYFFKKHIEEISISLIFKKERRANAEAYLHYIPQLRQICDGRNAFGDRYNIIKQFVNRK